MDDRRETDRGGPLGRLPSFGDPDIERRAIVLNFVSLFVAVVLVGITVANALFDPNPIFRIASGAALLAAIALCQALLRAGRPIAAGHLFAATLWLTLAVAVVFSGGPMSFTTPILAAQVLIAGLVLGVRPALGYTALSIGFLAVCLLCVAHLPEAQMGYTPVAAFFTMSALILFTAVILALGLTQLTRQQKRAATLQSELQHSQRVESIGLLAGGIAHDFNNLLTVVFASLESIREQDVPSAMREPIEDIEAATERAADLTRQLLAFGRKQLLRSRRLDVNELVNDAERLLRRVIPERVEVIAELEDDLPAVVADMGQLTQVIVNLAVNARDAIVKEGTITLRTRRAEVGPERAARLGLSEPGEHVVIEVVDDGVGMAPEVAARAFDPFFTTKEAGKGTGLGLSTTLGIIEQTGGAVQIESELGAGTTIRLYLPPMAPTAPETAAPSTVPPPSDPEGGKTILLAEDDVLLRRILVRMLERTGYRVVAASDGAEALELAHAHDGPIHLLITDAIMPAMGGTELIQRMRAEQPDIPVLLVSGYGGEQIDELDSIGALTLLPKPFPMEVLLAKVGEALDG